MSAAQTNLESPTTLFDIVETIHRDFEDQKLNMGFKEFVEEWLKRDMPESMKKMVRSLLLDRVELESK